MALAKRLREAAYDLPDGRKVWFDAGDALRDAVDLYTVLSELHGTGSPNIENLQARTLLEQLQRGGSLSEVDIGTLRRLLARHGTRVELLRRRKDRGGQDLLDVPSAGPDSRIIQPDERT